MLKLNQVFWWLSSGKSLKNASRVKFRDWERNRNFKLYLFMSLLNSHNDGEFGGNENRGFSRGSGLMKERFCKKSWKKPLFYSSTGVPQIQFLGIKCSLEHVTVSTPIQTVQVRRTNLEHDFFWAAYFRYKLFSCKNRQKVAAKILSSTQETATEAKWSSTTSGHSTSCWWD